MGNYATNQELIDRCESEAAAAHLTRNPGGDPDQDVLTAMIDEAEGYIESFLAMRYAIPVSTSDARVAAVLQGATLDLALFNLMGDGSVVPESIKVKRDAVEKWLIAVAAGKAVLPGQDAPPTTTASRSPRVKSSFADREFTRENLSGL
jgi:phage gp36-like protein